VGVQLPLMMRILKARERFEDVVARGFAVDYVGALAGSLLFSLVLMPQVGVVRATLVLGLLDVAAALGLAAMVRDGAPEQRAGWALPLVVGGLLVVLLALAPGLEASLQGAL
jgi:spermidine synthase